MTKTEEKFTAYGRLFNLLKCADNSTDATTFYHSLQINLNQIEMYVCTDKQTDKGTDNNVIASCRSWIRQK